VLIRDAAPGDGRAFEQVRVAGWRAAYRGIIDDEVLDALEVEDARVEQREAQLAAPPADEVFLVAEVDGTVVGGALLLPARDDDLDDAAELAALYVEPALRYAGIGSALLRAGYDRMPQPLQVLWVLEANAAGRRFYERHGFRPDGHRAPAERIPGSPDEVRYGRPA
jgi:GNAT superfamily N-acetyltransferase